LLFHSTTKEWPSAAADWLLGKGVIPPR